MTPLSKRLIGLRICSRVRQTAHCCIDLKQDEQKGTTVYRHISQAYMVALRHNLVSNRRLATDSTYRHTIEQDWKSR